MLTVDHESDSDDRRSAGPGPAEARRDLSEPAVVVGTLPNKMLLVETRNGARVAVHASGSMRIAIIRLVPGDVVRIERSPFDATKGRIVGIDGGHPARARSAPNDRTRQPHTDPESAP